MTDADAARTAALPGWRRVLTFWFDETDPAKWWAADANFDRAIADEFGAVWNAATQGELFGWRDAPEGRLAEIVVLDQFSRNLHRGSARAFAQDAMALTLAQEAVLRSIHRHLPQVQAGFLLMPYMHSESRSIHVQAERLFREYASANNHDYELRHKAIIDRFGRYPHRNQALGRDSTPEEVEFLKQPGSSF